MTGRAVHVLVVVAHPDDAEIALGGAIARWTRFGSKVTVACCSTSESTPELAERRRRAAEDAAAVLGHELCWVVPGEVRQVEDVPEHRLVGLIDRLVGDLDVDVVITHSAVDSHVDHRRVAAAVGASSRTWPTAAMLELGVSEHRTAAYTQFQPTVVVPVADQLKTKRAALDAYSYAGQGFRSLDVDGGELRSRALGSLAGVEAAEPLAVVRVVAGTRGGRGLAHLLTMGNLDDQ